MDFIAGYIIEKGIDGTFHVMRHGYRYAIKQLREYAGIETPEPFGSVSEFWYEGVDGGKVGANSLVTISGVVSAYVPATPRHPRSIPGKQVDTWVGLNAPVGDFAHADFFLWNDGIVALPSTLSRKAILGINDKYGYVGAGGIPIIVDLNNRRLRAAFDEVQARKPIGFEAKITGRLVNFLSPDIQAMGFSGLPKTFKTTSTYQAFALEVYKIALVKPHVILTGTVWAADSPHKVRPVYCDLFKFEDHAKAIRALSAQAGAGAVYANYDSSPIVPWSQPTPMLNQQLQDEFQQF